jgi:hypothetical protein
MGEEAVRAIVQEVLIAQRPTKREAVIAVLNPILVSVSSALLIAALGYFYALMQRVDNVETRLNNMVDLNIYQSRMIDHNFKQLAPKEMELNTIYIPEMIFSRGGGSSHTQNNSK